MSNDKNITKRCKCGNLFFKNGTYCSRVCSNAYKMVKLRGKQKKEFSSGEKSDIILLYNDKLMPIYKIAKIYSVDFTVIKLFLTNNGIKTRGNSEASKIQHKRSEYKNPWSGERSVEHQNKANLVRKLNYIKRLSQKVVTEEDILKEYNKGKQPWQISYKFKKVTKDKIWNIITNKLGEKRTRYGTHCTAKCGHHCWSKSERKICNLLYDNNIEHDKDIPYAGKFKCDWKIDDVWVEFFGLKEASYKGKTVEKLSFLDKNDFEYIALYEKDLCYLQERLVEELKRRKIGKEEQNLMVY
jgi:hypothetical protein